MGFITFFLIGFVAGAVVLFLINKSNTAVLNANLQNKAGSLADMENKYKELQSLHNELKEHNAVLRTEKASLQKEIDLLKEQTLKDANERNRHFEERLDLVKKELQNATFALLKQREEDLSKTNTVQMTAVINPLKETIGEMKKSMMENIKTNSENKASLEKAIEDLMKRTVEIGHDANNLAKALKNESKTQGNWGELILENILEKSGLKEGIHFVKQAMIRDVAGNAVLHDESGKRLIPDVIVHYPDNKDVIIDSKVSLSAFSDFCNSESEEEKQVALKRHVESMRNHVKELQRKDYSSYVKSPRQTLNYMIMFVPNESAMQIALYHDSSLWRDAFDKGIFITSEQNLLALLRMIQLAWTQVQQAKNQQEIFDSARKLLDRITDFVKKFEDVGKKLEAAQKSYDETYKKVYDGNQSVLKAAKEMVNLGADTSSGKKLPVRGDDD